MIVRLPGDADRTKFGVAGVLTVRAIVVVRVRPPPVPVTVTVACPVAAVPEAVNVSVLPVAETGLNAAVTPLGSPLAARVTAPVNPPERAMAIALVPLAP